MRLGPLDTLRTLARDEASRAQGFMLLLMKPRNGEPWTKEDRRALRLHLRHLARTLPMLGVFALPGGSLLLPLLAYFLDRRRQRALAPGALPERRPPRSSSRG
jgi:hypothetical protein